MRLSQRVHSDRIEFHPCSNLNYSMRIGALISSATLRDIGRSSPCEQLSSNPSNADFLPPTSTSARTSLPPPISLAAIILLALGNIMQAKDEIQVFHWRLDVSQRLMAAGREMVRQQCTLKSTADLLLFNFIFTMVFLQDNLPPETASRLNQQPVANPRATMLIYSYPTTSIWDRPTTSKADHISRREQRSKIVLRVTSYRPMHTQESCVIEPRNLLSMSIPTLNSQ